MFVGTLTRSVDAKGRLLVPAEMESAVIAGLAQAVMEMYPTLVANEDYTAIINERHRARLQGLVDDAVGRGAELIELNPAREDFSLDPRKLPLVVAGFALFGLSLEKKCTIHHDGLAGLEAREHLDFRPEIAAASDPSDFEVIGILRQKHTPLVAHTLNRRDRNRQNRGTGLANR